MEKVRIQDDLYTYVNQEKLDQLVIPDDQPSVGGFQTLANDVEAIMIKEFNEMCDNDTYPNDFLKKACILFKTIKNVEKKEQDGVAPALKSLSVLKDIKNIDEFNKQFKSLMLKKIPLPINIMVETDMKNTSKHCIMIQGPSVILPDASYYKEEMAQQKEMILGIWTNVARMIISKTDLSLEDQNKYIEDTLAFDALLGKLVKTSEEWSEYIKIYNPMKTSRVATLLKPLKFKSILNDLFNSVSETIIVTEPRFFKNFSEVFNDENFEMYKHWAYVNGFISACSYLTEEVNIIVQLQVLRKILLLKNSLIN